MIREAVKAFFSGWLKARRTTPHDSWQRKKAIQESADEVVRILRGGEDIEGEPRRRQEKDEDSDSAGAGDP